MIKRPESNEYPPFFQGYVESVATNDIIQFLEKQNNDFVNQLTLISPEKANFRYAPDKWSVKEVLGHIIDIERAMAYRAFSFSREEEHPLPGIDQHHYTPRGNFDYRNFDDLIKEFKFLRLSNLQLYASIDDQISRRAGIADQNSFTVRALVYITAGHLEHHRQVLRERYEV